MKTSDRPSDVLVRGPNWVGDLVMSTPGFRALRTGLPDARITLQVRPGLEPLLDGSPYFDDVISVASYHQGVRAMLREARAFRSAHRIDLGLCIPDSFSSALWMRAAGVERVVGYGGRGRGWLLDDAVPVPEAWGARRFVARERFVLGLVDAVGCEAHGTELALFTTEPEEEAVDALLAREGVGSDQPLVALAPGASFGPSKQWPATSFARVADALSERGVGVVLVGAPSEQEIARDIHRAMQQGKVIDCVGTLGLGAAKALLRRSALVICNDAGARHIAVAFGVPCIVFFGPTSVEKTNLNLEGLEILETADSCRPCYKRRCPIDHRCMLGITSERVIALAELLLSETA